MIEVHYPPFRRDLAGIPQPITDDNGNQIGTILWTPNDDGVDTWSVTEQVGELPTVYTVEHPD